MKEKILECFLYSDKLKFSDIERSLKVRSNALAYHLGKLVGEGVLERDGEFYFLGSNFESLIPYVSDKKHVLSVLLVHVGDDRKVFLVERKKKPYLGLKGLPGGRMILGESVEEGARRILKKFGVRMKKFSGIRSVSLEHLEKNGKRIASYLLVLVSAEADVKLVDLKRNKKNIIESDYELIVKGGSIEIEEIESKLK